MSESYKKGFLDRIMSEADDSAHPFLQKIQDNIKLIVLVVGSVLAIAAVYSIHSFWQERKISNINAELTSIMAEESAETRLALLQGFLGQAPDRLKGAIVLELAGTSMNLEKFQDAADYFAQLGQLDRDMRPVAILGQAKAYELLGDYERAVATLKQREAQIPGEFKNQYLTLLSFNAERAGDYQTALEAYQKLKDDVQGTDPGFIEYKIDQLRLKISS
ncbi:tetratricopeptide repeat protein [Desulfonatronovibrio hydrogenovorans]|uniref:tetratricopeptide repeat protein n=1 Tax=Desulfonatronovibrio hydrogenovorans TaxID=53245 RepID=UPI00048F451B|nr:hypothetical protein [Desulfonatronovibrio hydrogenovorans]